MTDQLLQEILRKLDSIIQRMDRLLEGEQHGSQTLRGR